MKYYLIIILLLLGFIKTVLSNPETYSNLNTVTEDVGENLVRFTDKDTDIVCYYVNGFPEGLSCVKL